MNIYKKGLIRFSMSFFDDFFKNFEIKNANNEIMFSFVVDLGMMIIGDLKIVELSDIEIVLSSKNKLFKINGNNLKLISASKGEIVIGGEIFSFLRCENERKIKN